MNIYAILCLNAQVIQMKKQKDEREKLYEKKKKKNTYKLVDVVMSLASKPGDMMSGVITNTYTNHDWPYVYTHRQCVVVVTMA